MDGKSIRAQRLSGHTYVDHKENFTDPEQDSITLNAIFVPTGVLIGFEGHDSYFHSFINRANTTDIPKPIKEEFKKRMAKVFKKYKVVKGDSVETFEPQVNTLIKKGWEPHGSLQTSRMWVYMQPMVKIVVDNKPEKLV